MVAKKPEDLEEELLREKEEEHIRNNLVIKCFIIIKKFNYFNSIKLL
jgi:hypothetical protein